MIREHDAVTHAVEVVRTVIDDRGVTVKQIAHKARCDVSTIYRMLSGERTLDITIPQIVFALTKDIRLVELITFEVPVACLVMERPERTPPIEQLYRETADAVAELAQATPHIADVLQDQKVDMKDKASIDAYRKVVSTVSGKCAQVLSNLDALMRQSTKEAV